MTVRIRAENKYSTLVEVSPQRILYEIFGIDANGKWKTLRYSFPLPWTYVMVDGARSGYGYPRPQYILGANKPIARNRMKLCPLPLIGLSPSGYMCQGSIRISGVGKPETRILSAVTGALASSGYASPMYVSYVAGNAAFLLMAAQAKTSPKEPSWDRIQKVYKYWESLEEFPGGVSLSLESLIDWRFDRESFLSKPIVLAE